MGMLRDFIGYFMGEGSAPKRVVHLEKSVIKSKTDRQAPGREVSIQMEKILDSARYRESDYLFKLVNNQHALYCTSIKKYVDLKSTTHTWSKKDRFFDDCLGTEEKVIESFNNRVPEEYNFVTESETDIFGDLEI